MRIAPAVLVLVLGCKTETDTIATASSTASSAVASAPMAEPTPPDLPTRLRTAKSFVEAVAIVKPELADSRDEEDPAAMALAHWSATGLKKWDEPLKLGPVVELPEFLKDPDAARGRPVVIGGTIGEIRVVRGPWGQLARGTLGTKAGKSNVTVYFYAAGPTGKLVAHDEAVLFGAATGQFSYGNVSGGLTKSILVVGAFAFTPDGKPIEKVRERKGTDPE
jgi:hypothetical protein